MESKHDVHGHLPAVMLKCFTVLFFVLMAVVWFCLSFFNRASDEIHTAWQLLAAFFILLLVAAACLLYTTLKRHKGIGALLEKRAWWLAAGGMACVFVLQVVMVANLYTPIGWDAAWTLEAATAASTYQRVDYFTAYPNNLLLAFYERMLLSLFNLFGAVDPWLSLSLFGVLSVDIAILTIYATAYRAYGVSTAYATLFFSVLLFGFTPWLIVPYSDIYSMPFVTGILYLYVRCSESTRLKSRVATMAFCGALAAIGFMLKPHVAVMVIAIAMIHLLYLKKADAARTALSFATLAVVALVVYGVFQLFIQYQELVPVIPGRAFPLEHFLNTGLSSDPDFGAHGAYGGYSQENVNAIQNLTSTAEMRAVSRAMIKERLGEMGLGGYLSFLFSKLRWVTSEGYFYWGLEGGFADFTQREPNFFTQIFYRGGAYFETFLYTAQGVWVVVLLFVTIAAGFAVLKKTERTTIVIECAIFGLLCFLMLFEGRARYLISYLPCFSLLAAAGLVRFSRKWRPFVPRKWRKDD